MKAKSHLGYNFEYVKLAVEWHSLRFRRDRPQLTNNVRSNAKRTTESLEYGGVAGCCGVKRQPNAMLADLD